MDSFNASVPDESKSQLAVEGPSSNQKDQCSPMQSPPLGTLKLVAGNGTSIGTVMTLQCPFAHRAVNGGLVKCMQDSNMTQWTGGVPECKPISRYEAQGFRLAVFASIISLAIIIFMSVIFITSCLLKYVKREEIKRRERERKQQAAEFWAPMDHQYFEEQREAFHGRKGRNNNNNNNKSLAGSNPEQRTQHPVAHPAVSIQHTCNNLPAECRCSQESLRTSCPSKLHPGPVPSAAAHVNTQTSCALPSYSTHLPYDHSLEEQPQSEPLLVPVDTHDWISGTTGQSSEGMEDPVRICQLPTPKPICIISV